MCFAESLARRIESFKSRIMSLQSDKPDCFANVRSRMASLRILRLTRRENLASRGAAPVASSRVRDVVPFAVVASAELDFLASHQTQDSFFAALEHLHVSHVR